MEDPIVGITGNSPRYHHIYCVQETVGNRLWAFYILEI